MSDEDSPSGEVERLVEDIRGDWRRLSAADSDLEKRRIRQDMLARFEALRRQMEDDPNIQ
jgi:hypothetical protein